MESFPSRWNFIIVRMKLRPGLKLCLIKKKKLVASKTQNKNVLRLIDFVFIATTSSAAAATLERAMSTDWQNVGCVLQHKRQHRTRHQQINNNHQKNVLHVVFHPFALPTYFSLPIAIRLFFFIHVSCTHNPSPMKEGLPYRFN